MFVTDLPGEPLPGLPGRTLGDTCLWKFLVSPLGPDIPQALCGPLPERVASQDGGWVWVGTS